jgi:hypothetical protein
MVVGALKHELTQHALEAFGSAIDVASGLAARARDARSGLVRCVRVEPRLDRARGDAQRLPTGGRLKGLEIPAVDGGVAYERGDLLRNLRLERRTEPPFSRRSAAGSARRSISASANRSQATQYSSVASRNCRPVSIWRRTVSACVAAMSRVCVVPATERVRLK